MDSYEIVVGILLAMFAGLILMLVGIYLAMPLGPLWAPFAALICYLTARAKGLSPGRYAAIGALYSALFFLPWVYLIARMYNKTIPNALVWTGYVVLYAIWFFGSIIVNLIIGFAAHPGEDHVWDLTNIEVLLSYAIFIIFCINLGTWVLSIAHLHTSHERFVREPSPLNSLLPHRSYIMPFAHTLAWVVIVWLVIWLRILYG